LTLDSMPGPEDLAPLGAYLVGRATAWCSGQVLFAGGPEVAVIDQPRLIEVVRSADVKSLEAVLRAVVPRALLAAEAGQATEGGSNPRFGPIFDETAPAQLASSDVKSCAIVSDRPELAASVTAALEARSITCIPVEPAEGFDGAAAALRAVAEVAGPIDAVVAAFAGQEAPAAAGPEWRRVLADHQGVTDQLHTDAAWARAAADYASGADRPVRLVTMTDARSPAGRSRAQAAAQLARVAAGGTHGRLTAFAVGLEVSAGDAAHASGELVGYLLANPETAALAGAELAVGDGWIGLRSHPRPIGTITYGGPAVPSWLDASLREIVGATGHSATESP
jgi:hypothetical protein